MSSQKTYGSYIAWLSVAFFYFYVYILRVSPNIISEQLLSQFRMTAQQFSTLGSISSLAYAILQIPLGIIVDKIGVKKTVIPSIALCVIGSLLFGVAEQLWLLQLGRLIIGIGSSSAFMCAIKTVVDQFPIGKRGILMGLTLTIGTIGPLISGKLLIYITSLSNWRYILYYSAALGTLIALIIHFSLPSSPTKSRNDIKSFNDLPSNLCAIIKNPGIILYTILAVGLYSPFSVISELWGTSFLKQKYGLTQAAAAHLSSLMFLGLAVGSLILPWFNEKFNILNKGIIFCSFTLLALFALLIYGPYIPHPYLVGILISVGFFSGAEMMCFTGALQVDDKNSGEIIGVVNTFNMLGTALFDYIIGFVLDGRWNGTISNDGIRYYSTMDYSFALSILTIILLICCVASVKLFQKKYNN